LLQQHETFSHGNLLLLPQNILIAATALGLGTCWIAGDKKPYIDKIAALVNAPENYTLVSSIALGYPIENHPSQPAKLSLEEVID